MAHSQTFRLRERMAEAKIQHGQEVRADLPGVRVSAIADDWRRAPDERTGIVFFCNMGPIHIREVLTTGDGRPLPNDVTLDGLTVPDSGTYDLLNLLVHSNGTVRLVADAATRIVPRAREFDPAYL